MRVNISIRGPSDPSYPRIKIVFVFLSVFTFLGLLRHAISHWKIVKYPEHENMLLKQRRVQKQNASKVCTVSDLLSSSSFSSTLSLPPSVFLSVFFFLSLSLSLSLFLSLSLSLSLFSPIRLSKHTQICRHS